MTTTTDLPIPPPLAGISSEVLQQTIALFMAFVSIAENRGVSRDDMALAAIYLSARMMTTATGSPLRTIEIIEHVASAIVTEDNARLADQIAAMPTQGRA